MLETINLNEAVEQEVYEQIFPALEAKLTELQRQAKTAGIPVIILFEGWDSAGKGTHINRLMPALDPRGFKVWGIKAPTAEEQYYPFLWRFWNKLPANGAIGIFHRSWYQRVLIDRVDKLVPKSSWRRAYDEILSFERQLTDDGAVIIKFWLHISKKEQKKRFKEISQDESEAWKIDKEAWRHHKQYDKYAEAVEEMLVRTSTAGAPWTVVATHDRRFARIKVFQTIITAIEQALIHKATPQHTPVPLVKPVLLSSIFDTVLLDKKLAEEEYNREIERLQQKFRDLEHQLYSHRLPMVIVYEGWDASGKGGNIKRLTQRLDPRGYEVIPIAAPAGEERLHHYLWRFWRHIPKAGHITIFDRSWYGRVLVERIEGFCQPNEWQRAFQEINEFEQQLAAQGTIIVKFWLHVSQEEQLARFVERQNTPSKSWKITDEDWRNREKWPEYEQAASDMIHQTSTSYAPWTIIESVDKNYARVKSLRTVAKAMELALAKHAL